MAGEARGSEKLWERVGERPHGAHLADAISAAENEFSVKRWWWRGQPAIDLIEAELEVELASAGKVLGGLIDLQGKGTQINFSVFPYGIIAPDLLRVNVQINRDA
jgi:hypothetical protein